MGAPLVQLTHWYRLSFKPLLGAVNHVRDHFAAFTFVNYGVFYSSSPTPKVLKKHYSFPRIAHSLRTRAARVAEARARRAADRLDDYRFHLRSKDTDLLGKHILRLQEGERVVGNSPPLEVSSASVKLSEAVGIYQRLKGQSRPDTFHRAAESSPTATSPSAQHNPHNVHSISLKKIIISKIALE